MQFKMIILFFVVRYCVSEPILLNNNHRAVPALRCHENQLDCKTRKNTINVVLSFCYEQPTTETNFLTPRIPIDETVPSLTRYFDNRIIGGSQAPEGQFPYMAAILIGDDIITVLTCGGALALPNLILTAAHCIDVYRTPDGLMSSFHAVVGSNNFKSGGIKVEFGGYHIHPDWNQVTMKNDIGCICLKKKLVLNDKVQLVALNFDFIDRVEPSFVVGWGLITTRPSITPFNLQILEVETLEPQDCVDRVSSAAATMWPDAPTVDPELEICSFHSNGGQVPAGLCYGDSGSPLISRVSGSQIAITSWAFPCALGVPDMHTRLSSFEHYIKDIMALYQ